MNEVAIQFARGSHDLIAFYSSLAVMAYLNNFMVMRAVAGRGQVFIDIQSCVERRRI